MRRHLIIAILLLAGMVANVPVAWGCALLISPTPDSWAGAARVPHRSWICWVRRGFGVENVFLMRGSISGPASVPLPEYAVVPPDRHGDTKDLVYASAGWPSLSFRASGMVERSYTSGRRLFPGEVGYPPVAWQSVTTVWPGFVVNTVFYAAVLWLAICGPFVLRRFIRVKRGLCPACAYPMGEAAVCTECGRELPSRARPAT
jgi:hypothetical protein